MRLAIPILVVVLAACGPAAPPADPASAAPAAPDPAAPEPPATTGEVTAADVVGHWTGDWGDLYLKAMPDGSLRGVYPHDTGTVTGRMEGGVMRGWWCEAPSRRPNQDAGAVEFTFLRAAGGAFDLDGRWKYGADEATWRENWDLRWVDGALDPQLAARFEDDAQFCATP